jgi:hypothetical protein
VLAPRSRPRSARDCTTFIVPHHVKRVLADIDADHGDCRIELVWHGVLLVFGAPCQLPLLAGPEHGRTIPLADIDLRSQGFGTVLCIRWGRHEHQEKKATAPTVAATEMTDAEMDKLTAGGSIELGPNADVPYRTINEPVNVYMNNTGPNPGGTIQTGNGYYHCLAGPCSP